MIRTPFHTRLAALLSPLALVSGALAAEPAWWERVDPAKLAPASDPVESVIDRHIDAKLADRGVTPAAPAPAATRFRRLMLDLHGRIPTVAELDAFLAEGDAPAAWQNWVDKLIAAKGFERHLTHELNWLLMDGQGTDYQKYLAKAVSDKKGWDDIFRESIAAQADPEIVPGVDQFLRQRLSDQDKMVNDVSVRFFGVNVSCAQCHDHPYVDWSQDTYYGMKSFFARTFENGGFVAEREYGLVSYKTTKNEEKQAGLRFLGGAALPEPSQAEPNEQEKKAERERLEQLKKDKQAPPPAKYSRRARLIEAGLADGNEHWFARAIVNRVWDRFFGCGLVMPLDQMHGQNAPSHPELMQWLARDLAAHEYDLRRLIRGIVSSRAWQRDSVWESGDRPPMDLFAVAHPRPLSPRQYAVSLRFATSAPEMFTPGKAKPEEIESRIENTELSGTGYERWFERPGESFNFAVEEALFLSNSTEVQDQLLEGGLVKSLGNLPTAEARIRMASRSVIQREPSDEEIALLSSYLDARTDRPEEGLRQVVWALLSSNEARFNH